MNSSKQTVLNSCTTKLWCADFITYSSYFAAEAECEIQQTVLKLKNGIMRKLCAFREGSR